MTKKNPAGSWLIKLGLAIIGISLLSGVALGVDVRYPIFYAVLFGAILAILGIILD